MGNIVSAPNGCRMLWTDSGFCCFVNCSPPSTAAAPAPQSWLCLACLFEHLCQPLTKATHGISPLTPLGLQSLQISVRELSPNPPFHLSHRLLFTTRCYLSLGPHPCQHIVLKAGYSQAEPDELHMQTFLLFCFIHYTKNTAFSFTHAR